MAGVGEIPGEGLFASFRLVHNRRQIRRIEISPEGDGAFAVVDIDTLWLAKNGTTSLWKGRVCTVYAAADEWKLTMHTGVLRYPERQCETDSRFLDARFDQRQSAS